MLCIPSVVIVLIVSSKVPSHRFPDDLLSPLTELRDITLSLQDSNAHNHAHMILSSVVSTKVNTVTLVVWTFQYQKGLEDFCLRWMKIENALCRLSNQKERAGSGGKIVLNVNFDDQLFANRVSIISERGELLPRFQEVGVVNVDTRPMGVDPTSGQARSCLPVSQ